MSKEAREVVLEENHFFWRKYGPKRKTLTSFYPKSPGQIRDILPYAIPDEEQRAKLQEVLDHDRTTIGHLLTFGGIVSSTGQVVTDHLHQLVPEDYSKAVAALRGRVYFEARASDFLNQYGIDLEQFDDFDGVPHCIHTLLPPNLSRSLYYTVFTQHTNAFTLGLNLEGTRSPGIAGRDIETLLCGITKLSYREAKLAVTVGPKLVTQGIILETTGGIRQTTLSVPS